MDESLRGRGLGQQIMAEAMQFCREKGYPRIFLTTLPGLDAAMRLYAGHGFRQVGKNEQSFHGSEFAEMRLEKNLC